MTFKWLVHGMVCCWDHFAVLAPDPKAVKPRQYDGMPEGFDS